MSYFTIKLNTPEEQSGKAKNFILPSNSSIIKYISYNSFNWIITNISPEELNPLIIDLIKQNIINSVDSIVSVVESDIVRKLDIELFKKHFKNNLLINKLDK